MNNLGLILTIASSVLGIIVFLFKPKSVKRRKQNKFMKQIEGYKRKADECYQKNDMDGYNRFVALSNKLRAKADNSALRR